MKISLFLIISIFLLQSANAQSVIDSLEQKLPDSKGKEKIQILIGLADALSTINTDKALSLGEEAYKLAHSENEVELMAESLEMIGVAYFYSYNFIKAAEYLKQSLDIYKELSDENNEAKISQNIGLAYLQANQYDSSEVYLQQAYKSYVNLNEPKNIAYCHTNLGLLYYFKSEYATALNHYNRASEIYKEIDDPVNHANLLNRIAMTYWLLGINDKAITFALESVKEREKIAKPDNLATGYNNIGAIYKDLGEDEKALDYFRRALSIYQQAGDSMGIPSALTNIGSIYSQDNNPDSVLFYYEKSLMISDAVGDEFQSAKTRHNIGLVFKEHAQLDTALVYIQDYLNYCSQIGNNEGIAIASLNLGRIFMEMENYEETESYLIQSVSLADSLDLLPTLRSAYAALSKLREIEGNNKDALEYYQLSSQLNDSIFNIEKAKAISEMETKYETEKKEQENILLKKDIELEKRKSSYLVIVTIVLLLAGVVSIALFYFIRKNALSKKKLAELESEKLEEKVAHQKRELASSTLTLSRNLEFINSLIEDIGILTEFVDNDKAYASINRIVKKLEQQNSDKCWEEFETRFQEIHRNFYKKLHDSFPGLTTNDVKLCALLKMGMNTKEICSVTFQNVRAVEAARLRLRKKLRLEKRVSLASFLQKF